MLTLASSDLSRPGRGGRWRELSEREPGATVLVQSDTCWPAGRSFALGGAFDLVLIVDLPVAGQRFTECQSGQLHSYMGPTLGGAFYGYNAEPGRIIQIES